MKERIITRITVNSEGMENGLAALRGVFLFRRGRVKAT